MEFYQQRIDEQDRKIASIKQREHNFSRSRGIVFLVSLVLFLGWATGFGIGLLVLAALFFVGFVAVVGYHERAQRDLKQQRIRREIATHQQARRARDWTALPDDRQQPSQAAAELIARGTPVVVDDTVVADLDTFGPGSVWLLVNQASTPLGEKTLHSWLRTPAMPQEIAARQAAVQALAKRPDFCLELYQSGRLLSDTRGNDTEFLSWAEGEAWLGRRPNLIWATRFLAAAMILLTICLVLEWVPVGWTLALLVLFVVHVIFNMVWIGQVHDLFNRVSAGKYDMQYFTEMFQAVASLPDDVPRLGQLKAKMHLDDVQFETAFSKLQRILQFANGRKSGLLGIPWLIAQILWFWDFHVLLWLENWQQHFGKHVRHWFEAVGELEALASLATLAHDHPDWQFPVVRDDEDKLSAKAMGHALLSPDQCVVNDVQLGPQGTFLLVTGSNMSGKSTLLRSIGVNTMLSLAGGPVCAKEFRLPPVELATSMRIVDSLNSGVSYFMAELQRVKKIVDRARELDENSEPRMLYLLDEILTGTNSAERLVAVTRILKHLLSTRAIGAVSTHDLDLADAEEIKNNCQLVHLRETIEKTADGDRMRFDYIVHDGVTPTTNALRLLELVGLGEYKKSQ